MKNETTCIVCDFTLFNPIENHALQISQLGLYNDARFPGRSILKFNEHVEFLEDINVSLTFAFMNDIKASIQAIKIATGVERVNVAILGNAVPHVHAHLIPRYPESEEFPNQSPWNDKRQLLKMDQKTLEAISDKIKTAFTDL